MTGKERMDLRLKTTGGSVRGDLVRSTKNVVDRFFMDDPSYFEGVIFWGTNKPINIRVFDHKMRASGTPQRSIETPHDEPFVVGDMFILGSDGVWLCVEAYDAHGINNRGKINYCNAMVSFKVKDMVYSYPMETKNATQYNSGETPRTQMTIGSSQHLCYVSCDDITVKIDNGFRFILDRNMDNPTVYRLTQVDATSYSYGPKGILQWTVVEDQFRKGIDDPVTGICASQQELNFNGQLNNGDNSPNDGRWL